ncbi:cobalamin biosynthesis protein [Kitasatospora terrestris]|uniref:CobE/GbiG C-terminal domain-containing protein n=1 Tax=Kitasatospora terrestris TaxID=258051 RepID=A0ABP9E5F4_9ACTN
MELRVAVGVGARRGTDGAEVLRLIDTVLSSAGLRRDAVALLATLDAKTAEPGLLAAARALGVPLTGFPAERLAAVPVPGRSPAALAAVGTPSVAEAAALAAAPGGRLLAGKRTSANATAALAGPLVTGEPT